MPLSCAEFRQGIFDCIRDNLCSWRLTFWFCRVLPRIGKTLVDEFVTRRGSLHNFLRYSKYIPEATETPPSHTCLRPGGSVRCNWSHAPHESQPRCRRPLCCTLRGCTSGFRSETSESQALAGAPIAQNPDPVAPQEPNSQTGSSLARLPWVCDDPECFDTSSAASRVAPRVGRRWCRLPLRLLLRRLKPSSRAERSDDGICYLSTGKPPRATSIRVPLKMRKYSFACSTSPDFFVSMVACLNLRCRLSKKTTCLSMRVVFFAFPP